METPLSKQTIEADSRNSEQRSKYKSYRKKYHKIRSQFHKTLAENNVAWDREQNVQRVARRLEEELDQLRELLLDVNDTKSCPKHLTVSLTSSNVAEDDWLRAATMLPPTTDLDRSLQAKGEDYKEAEGYCAMHHEYEQELKRGKSTISDYRSAYKTALPYLNIVKSLAYLEDKVPHTRLTDAPRRSLPTEITEDAPLGYLHPDREAEYLERLDTEIAERWSSLGKLGPEQRPPANTSHVNFAARDNPTSALNWLRKCQPDVFLDGNDGSSQANRSQDANKGALGAAGPQFSISNGRRESNRAKRGSQVIQEVLDDDGSVIGLEPALKQKGGSSKRKRGNEDDDVSYHPSKGTTAPKKRVRKSAMEMAAERD